MNIFPLAYTEKETSAITRISVSKLQKSRTEPYSNIKSGKCPPFYKEDGVVLYRWVDVMDFMAERKIIGKPDLKKNINEEAAPPIKTAYTLASPFIEYINLR